ncbi:MAG: response regulator [Lachnospiraceae bacterium]|nr:response regulator [Lachnospiraceae bacterium]
MFRFLKENINLSCEDEKILQDYAAYLTHEIKTPLNSICGNLDIIKREGCLDNEYLNNAILAADYLAHLVDSVMLIFGIENDTDVTKAHAVTPEEVFKSINGILEVAAAEKNIKLQFLFGEKVYQYLYLNRAAIQQIIINLISNSIKYTDEGGTVLCRIAQKYLEEKRVKLFLEVEDTGIGMEEEFVSCVWDEFTREGRKEDAKGNGLGMSITKRLVELMNGSIKINTRPGHGTKVTIELDVDGDDIRYDLDAPPEKEEKQISEGIRGYTLPKRVLVAEDERANMDIICKYLEILGIEADKAYDGDEVMEIFNKSEENRYDVILMDINLPEKSGMEAVREIRKSDREDNGIPIVIITADTLDRHRPDILSAKINGYIIKPYSLEDVRTVLLKYRE